MSQIRLIGMDPSLNNWGLATGWFDLETQQFEVTHVDVIQPQVEKHKQVRTNSIDLQRAEWLLRAIKGCNLDRRDMVFVEVPVGSQSASGMKAYGICVGLLAALRVQGVPFIEVTPTEVKLAGAGSKTATKQEMIQWAYDQYPDINWPWQTQKGKTTIVQSKAEHMADAVATIHAGLQTQAFQQALAFHSAA